MTFKVAPRKDMVRGRRSTGRRSSRRGLCVLASAGALFLAPMPWGAVYAETHLALTADAGAEAELSNSRRQLQLREASAGRSGLVAHDKVRVLVRSYETVSISAEINARIIRLPEREGDRFRKGQILVEFDCRKIISELNAATALFKAHQAIYDNQRQMLHYKAAGTHAVDQARFEMEKAMADVEGHEIRRSSCAVHAPFDGRVTDKAAHVHEIAQSNQPLIKIINESKIELVLMVPSAWLPRVTDAATFTVKIDETGETHEARVVQSTGLIDPVSQSARIIAELQRPSLTVLPGMSGTAIFARPVGAP
jgi:membrane fusion protein, multidrug efflux system